MRERRKWIGCDNRLDAIVCHEATSRPATPAVLFRTARESWLWASSHDVRRDATSCVTVTPPRHAARLCHIAVSYTWSRDATIMQYNKLWQSDAAITGSAPADRPPAPSTDRYMTPLKQALTCKWRRSACASWNPRHFSCRSVAVRVYDNRTL